MITCPKRFISQAAPHVVTDNHCFVSFPVFSWHKRHVKVVDGDVADVDAELISRRTSDDDCWRPTGKATKYYYSSCMRKFYPVRVIVNVEVFNTVAQVQIIKYKGNILSACIRRRHNMPIPPELGPMRKNQRSVNVNLHDVFQVSRYYSCWRTCPYFHRIVSLVEPLKEGAQLDTVKREAFLYAFSTRRTGGLQATLSGAVLVARRQRR